MLQWVKAIAEQAQGAKLNSEPMQRWKERTDSTRLSFDLHGCRGTHTTHRNSLVAGALPWHLGSPGFDSQRGINVWWLTSVIPLLREVKAGGSGIQGHPWLHGEFKTSLD